MKITELSKGSHFSGGYSKPKAGIIPFFEDGTALFFQSNNAEYGGTDPSVAKGRIDKNESALESAIREGEEELGLKQSNFKSSPFVLWDGEITGMDATYKMTVYAVEVKSKTDFTKPGKETGSTKWLTLDEYESKGRKSQLHIVKKLEKHLKAKKPSLMARVISKFK